ncbi:shikimate kinase [Candidatus Vidania fulgoroideorum]
MLMLGNMLSGKTYFGNKISQRVDGWFCDSDILLCKIFNFAISRKNIYLIRVLERNIIVFIMRYYMNYKGSDSIVSLGGGAILEKINRARIVNMNGGLWIRRGARYNDMICRPLIRQVLDIPTILNHRKRIYENLCICKVYVRYMMEWFV